MSYAQNGKEELSTIENSLILFYANKMTSKLKSFYIKTKPVVGCKFEHCRLKLNILWA